MGKNNNILFILLTGALALVGVLLYRKTSAAPSTGSTGAPLNSIPVNPDAFTEVFTGGAPTQNIVSQTIDLLPSGSYNTQIYHSDGTLKAGQTDVKEVQGSKDVEFKGIKFKSYRGLGDKLQECITDFRRISKGTWDKEFANAIRRNRNIWVVQKKADIRRDEVLRYAKKIGVEVNLMNYYFPADIYQIWGYREGNENQYFPHQTELIEFINKVTP